MSEQDETPVDPAQVIDQALSTTYGGITPRWVLVAEMIDEDGDRYVFSQGSPGLANWEAVGLLTYALTNANTPDIEIAYALDEDEDE